MKYLTTIDHDIYTNTHVWIIAEHTLGKRVTKDMITFDTKREDVKINCYGVVMFYDMSTAQCLLSIDFPEVQHPFKSVL